LFADHIKDGHGDGGAAAHADLDVCAAALSV
jgi:hypothetical protein